MRSLKYITESTSLSVNLWARSVASTAKEIFTRKTGPRTLLDLFLAPSNCLAGPKTQALVSKFLIFSALTITLMEFYSSTEERLRNPTSKWTSTAELVSADYNGIRVTLFTQTRARIHIIWWQWPRKTAVLPFKRTHTGSSWIFWSTSSQF